MLVASIPFPRVLLPPCRRRTNRAPGVRHDGRCYRRIRTPGRLGARAVPGRRTSDHRGDDRAGSVGRLRHRVRDRPAHRLDAPVGDLLQRRCHTSSPGAVDRRCPGVHLSGRLADADGGTRRPRRRRHGSPVAASDVAAPPALRNIAVAGYANCASIADGSPTAVTASVHHADAVSSDHARRDAFVTEPLQMRCVGSLARGVLRNVGSPLR